MFCCPSELLKLKHSTIWKKSFTTLFGMDKKPKFWKKINEKLYNMWRIRFY